MDKYELKEVRGRILKVLQNAYPDREGHLVISKFLSDVGYEITPQEVIRQMDYLAGKGYIEKQTIKDEKHGIYREMGKLTPIGYDLVTGIAPDDPAIEVTGLE